MHKSLLQIATPNKLKPHTHTDTDTQTVNQLNSVCSLLKMVN